MVPEIVGSLLTYAVMRAVVQRVSEAAVSVDGREVSRIGPGLLVLLGVAQGDGEADLLYLADKVVNLRVFPDEAGHMNRSLLEAGGDFADGAIAYEGSWLGADTFVSFDGKAVKLMEARGVMGKIAVSIGAS